MCPAGFRETRGGSPGVASSRVRSGSNAATQLAAFSGTGLKTFAVGALGIVLKYKPDRNYERSTKFYGVVGSMIGSGIFLLPVSLAFTVMMRLFFTMT